MPTAPDSIVTRVVALAGTPPRDLEYAIRRRRRSRSIRLHVSDDGLVTVSAPPRVSARDLDAVVVERSGWIRTTVDAAVAAADVTRVDLRSGGPVPFRGEPLTVRVLGTGPGRRTGLRADPATGAPLLELAVAPGADPFDQLMRWYRGQARDAFTARVGYWSGRFGHTPGRLSIRDQRTRWGSCTARGDLSFNWRLILAPPWVLDAIVVHELCHIDHLDHSARFWALLDQRCPEHRAASAWLRAHGRGLHVRPAHAAEAVDGTPDAAREAAATIDRTAGPAVHAPDDPAAGGLTLF